MCCSNKPQCLKSCVYHNVKKSVLCVQIWCSFDDITGGLNVLVVKLLENGGETVANGFLYFL